MRVENSIGLSSSCRIWAQCLVALFLALVLLAGASAGAGGGLDAWRWRHCFACDRLQVLRAGQDGDATINRGFGAGVAGVGAAGGGTTGPVAATLGAAGATCGGTVSGCLGVARVARCCDACGIVVAAGTLGVAACCTLRAVASSFCTLGAVALFSVPRISLILFIASKSTSPFLFFLCWMTLRKLLIAWMTWSSGVSVG